MTTSRAALLPRREGSGPPGADGAESSLPVLGGYASDGTPAGALSLWAQSRYGADFEFGRHSHEGLEILTVVLDGTMRHFDTATGHWADLNPGDVQMMQSGSGVLHVEHAVSGTRGFQIQFDPGPEAARREPSYTDYPAASFTGRPVGSAVVTDIVGHDGPVQTRTEGLTACRVAVAAGSRAELPGVPGRFTLAYLFEGSAVMNGVPAVEDDAISLTGASAITLDAVTDAELLLVSVPAAPSYQPRRLDPAEMRQHGRPGGPR